MNLNAFNLKYFISTLVTLLIFSTVFGQEFKEVKIGNQIWMSKNLNVDKFINGDKIAYASNPNQWLAFAEKKEPAWCYWEFDSKNSKYGKFYNGFVVIDKRYVAPLGWKLPSVKDFEELLDYLNVNKVDGFNMNRNKVASSKLRSSFDWDYENGTNSSGFSAFPYGEVRTDLENKKVEFINFGSNALFWSNEIFTENETIYILQLKSNSKVICCDGLVGDWYEQGHNIRLISDNLLVDRGITKNVSNNNNSQSSTNIGNDSKEATDYYESGRTKSFSNDYQGALIDFNIALQMGLVDSKLYLGIGFAEFKSNNFSSAIKNLSKSIDLESNKGAYLARASAYNSIKMFDEEIEDWSKVIELNNVKPFFDLSDAYCARGDAYFLSSKFSNAINDYSKAIELNPNNTIANNNLEIAKAKLKTWIDYFNSAEEKMLAEDYNGAIIDFSNSIQLNPNNSESYLYRSAVKCFLKNYKEALDDVNKSIQLNSNNNIAFKQRGEIKYYLNDFNGAIEDFSNAISLDKNDGAAYYNRGKTKISVGDYSGSLKDLSISIKLDPSNNLAYKLKEGLEKILNQSQQNNNRQ